VLVVLVLVFYLGFLAAGLSLEEVLSLDKLRGAIN